MKKNLLINGVSAKLQGFYKVAIVGPDDKIVWEMPEFKKNLILNAGMDLVATNSFANCFAYACAGTGTRPTSIASLATNASQAANTVTSSGGLIDFTTDAAVGDVIKFSTLEEATITSITDAHHVQASPSQSVASTSFTIWKTAQVGLQTEVKRSNTYLAGSGNCGTTIVGNVVELKRTTDFSTEAGPVNYTEIGFSPSSTPNTNVFSRILLGSPVALTSGQRLRVVYQLNVTCTPDTARSKTAVISGWPVSPSVNTDGNEQLQNLLIGGVDTSGAGFSNALDPSNNAAQIWVSPDSSALGTLGGSIPDRSTNASRETVTLASYSNGTYLRDKTGTFDVGEANRNDLRSMGIGIFIPGGFGPDTLPTMPSAQGLTFLFAQAQTKANTQTLSLTFRFTWGRTLA